MADKRYYPAFLDLTGRLVVVIGSGRTAERKARQLVGYGADVLIITPQPSPQLLAAQADGELGVETRGYVRGDLEGAALAICTSTDGEVRRAVFEEALRVGCPVNVAGAPELSTFLIPSVIHREPLQMAVSTGGGAPQIAKLIRRRLAEEYGQEWGTFTEVLSWVRVMAMERLDGPEAVDALLQAVIESDVLEQIAAGRTPSPVSVFERFAPSEADGAGESPEE